MKELFVPINLMKELEAKGFADDCICGYTPMGRIRSKVSTTSEKDCTCEWDQYDTEVRAATWMQIIDWFLITHDIFITPTYSRGEIKQYDCLIETENDIRFSGYKLTMQEAYYSGIEIALKLI